jgi:hypothetical protein
MAKIPNVLLSVAYGFTLLKSRPQLYRSYTELASLARPREILAGTYLVHFWSTHPSETLVLPCQLPKWQFLDYFRLADYTS